MPGDAITTDGQVQFADLLLGVGTLYPIEKIEGLDFPPMRTFDTPRTGLDGVTPGQDLYDRRTVRLTIGVDASVDGLLSAKVGELRRVFARSDVPVPMSFQLRGESRRYVMALPRRMAVAMDGDYSLNLPTVVVELDAPDPRILAAVEQSLTFGLTGVFVNGGAVPSHPVLTITGVATNPITVAKGGRTVRLNVTMISTDVMVVDFAKRTVLLNGANRYDIVDPTTRWWALDPGVNLLDANTATVETDAAGWAVSANCTISRSTAQARSGMGSLALKATGAGTAQAVVAATVPASPSTQYTALMSFRAAVTGRTVGFFVQWQDSGGGVLANASAPTIVDSASGWGQVALTATSPVNTAKALVFAQVLSPGANEVHYVDQASLAAGASTVWRTGGANVVAYAGGGTPTLAWRDAWM